MIDRRVAGQRVFVDTGAYAALANEGDARHYDAIDIARNLGRRRSLLYTTNFVIAETHALVVARANRMLALNMLERIDQGSGVTVRVDEGHERRAREIVASNRDKDFTLVDAMSFAVMEQLGIGVAFTFDRHFVQYGFALVGAD